MLEAAYAEYISETAPFARPPCPTSGDTHPPINGGAQDSSVVAGGDVVIEMSVMPSIAANGGEIHAEIEEQLQTE
jgi:hypothetical protein